MPGDTVNGFEVLDLLQQGGSGKHRRFLVRCDSCGQTVEMTSQGIKNNNSCGCLQKDSSTWKRKGAIRKPWKLPEGEASFNYLLYQYRKSAERRGIEFSLPPENFREIVTQPCHYCGSCCSSEKINKGSNGSFKYTGVDRKNNGEGYTLENSIPCCKTCNYMKLDHDYDFFLSHLQKILDYRSNEEL
jgi:hypothetical protein